MSLQKGGIVETRKKIVEGTSELIKTNKNIMDRTIARVNHFVILISLLFSHHTAAQVARGMDSDTFNTILFEVTSSDHGNVSYLFGTHHAFGKAFFDSLPKANQALSASEILIKENLNIPGQMAEDIINQRAGITQWKKYLGKEDLSFIENLFAASPTDFHKMTPTEMYTFLNRHFKQQICLHKNAGDTSLSLDDYISSRASQQNIARYGLESTEEQINLINKDVEGMPRKTHKRRLSNIINKIRTEDARDCEETGWYSEMGMSYQLSAPCTNTLMLTDRNDRWIKTISDLLEKRNCFIAVGLSHLMYECGLINQLTELGYTVTPMEVR